MTVIPLQTDRLSLIPISLETALSLLEGNRATIDDMGFKADEHWPTPDTMDILPIVCETLKKEGQPTGFEVWMIVEKEEKLVIGDIGFHGRPDDEGVVEVGFGLVQSHWGNGYGTEALSAILGWACKQDQVSAVKAGCLLTNQASAALLRKAGFSETGRDAEMIWWKFEKAIF